MSGTSPWSACSYAVGNSYSRLNRFSSVATEHAMADMYGEGTSPHADHS